MSKVLCLDLEMNQPSNKIIQIGYVIADLVTERIFLKRSIIVNPNEPLGFLNNQFDKDGKNISISSFTGITEDLIKKEGVSLIDAYLILCDDVKKHNVTKTCVQWGDGSFDNKGDHDHLRRELGLSWDDFVFRPRAWDVKSYYQIYRAFNNEGVVAGVDSALKHLGMSFEGKQHNALDDAYNTLRIFIKLGKKSVTFDKISKLTKS